MADIVSGSGKLLLPKKRLVLKGDLIKSTLERAEAAETVDVCFVIDTTGSMQPFINEAQSTIVNMARTVSTDSEVTVRLGLVEFKDHPPEGDWTFKNYQFAKTFEQFQSWLDGLHAYSGGDNPEAVIDGVHEASRIKWLGTRKLLFLVGDAPPHGVNTILQNEFEMDHWPQGCPDGLKWATVGDQVKSQGITFSLVPLTLPGTYGVRYTKNFLRSWKYIALKCGGEVTEGFEYPQEVFDKKILPEVKREVRALKEGRS